MTAGIQRGVGQVVSHLAQVTRLSVLTRLAGGRGRPARSHGFAGAIITRAPQNVEVVNHHAPGNFADHIIPEQVDDTDRCDATVHLHAEH